MQRRRGSRGLRLHRQVRQVLQLFLGGRHAPARRRPRRQGQEGHARALHHLSRRPRRSLDPGRRQHGQPALSARREQRVEKARGRRGAVARHERRQLLVFHEPAGFCQVGYAAFAQGLQPVDPVHLSEPHSGDDRHRGLGHLHAADRRSERMARHGGADDRGVVRRDRHAAGDLPGYVRPERLCSTAATCRSR